MKRRITQYILSDPSSIKRSQDDKKYFSSGNAMIKIKKQVVISAAIGGGLELFDFVIYLFLSPILASLFFPHQNKAIALLATLGGFAAGYFARPLGGIICGHFGDRIGRVNMLVFSLMLMGIPTFLMGCLPTYSSIGIMAPVFLVLFRFVQGLAMGGDVPGAICFIGEHVESGQRGFMTCCLLFGMNMGAVLASILVASLISLLSSPAMLNWGWRIPFFTGAFLAIVGFYIRRRTRETPEFKKYREMNLIERWPFKVLLKVHLRAMLSGLVVAGLAAGVTSIMSLFMATYMSHYLGIKSGIALWLNSISICSYSLCCLFAGVLIDRYHATTVLKIASITLFILAYPVFKLISALHHLLIMFGLLMSAPLLACIMGSVPMLLIKLFPAPVRYSGIGVSYNMGFSLLAGTSPMLVAFLISYTGIKMVPAFFIMFIVLCAFPIVFILNKKSVQFKNEKFINSNFSLLNTD